MTVLEEEKSPRRLYLRERPRPRSSSVWIDGTRTDSPFQNIGINGLAAAGLVNEATRSHPPNLGTYSGYYVTLRAIEPGEELLGCYGQQYVRTGYESDVHPSCKQIQHPGIPKECGKKRPPGIMTLLKSHGIVEPQVMTLSEVERWARDVPHNS